MKILAFFSMKFSMWDTKFQDQLNPAQEQHKYLWNNLQGASTEKKRKESAGSYDTASLSKGGGYIGARTRQPPTTQTHERMISVGQGWCVPWHPDPHLADTVQVVL